jgi:hypothetical protein
MGYNCLDITVSEWNLDKALQLRQYAQNFSMENYNKNLKLFITNWIESHSIKTFFCYYVF